MGRDVGQQRWESNVTLESLFSFGGFNFSIPPERCLEGGVREKIFLKWPFN